jgi:hypothetical protein
VCGKTFGECREGYQRCENGTWGACSEVGPATDVCDRLDNDCNGRVDDDCDCVDGETQRCGSSLGTCVQGTQTCELGRWKECMNATSPATETCDGLDTDCNGRIDDGCSCLHGATRWCQAGMGACRSGEQSCDRGEWGECVPLLAPVDETCNDLDDDCDGVIDNGFVLDAECNSLGKCPQVRACAADGKSSVCRDDARLFSDEICDGIDNDCNGLVDLVSEAGSLRSVCECDRQTLSIGDAEDVSIAGGVNLCAATQCGPDKPLKLSVDGTCYPTCQVPGSDPDGDGWGWEGGATCLVADSARARAAQPCGGEGPPAGMAMTYCLACGGEADLPYAMCESIPRFDLTRFVSGELWLRVDYSFTASGPAKAPVNLWFIAGGLRKRLPLVAFEQAPGHVPAQLLRAEDACFTPADELGADCVGAAEPCDQCGSSEACGALAECSGYDLTQATFQLAAEFCEPESGEQSGTVVVHRIELVEPNCED